MKFGIVTFPGSNCDYDAYKAVCDIVGEEAVYLWHKDRDLKGVDVVMLPGGFSYGDYLRPGAIARFSPIMNEVQEHAKRGGPVLGVCNGFQLLCEAGLLPGALLRNASLKFVSAPAYLRVENSDTLFTNRYNSGDVVRIPVAHGDGRYTADKETLDTLEQNNQVIFRYVSEAAEVCDEACPNGAMNNIAGIINTQGNVLGMMPHPERAVEDILESSDGLALFESILARVAA